MTESNADRAQVAALFVDTSEHGIYPRLLGPERCWGVDRDARWFTQPASFETLAVVAHPPCARWSRLAESVYARTGRYEHRPGNDGGCFVSALESVRRYGGVLEHPAESKAWRYFDLPAVPHAGWHGGLRTGWVCEVWQSAYGHLAAKRTWLLYCGVRPPFELRWAREPGTHVVGGDSKKRAALANPPPRLSANQNIATPPAFAEELIRLAVWSRLPSESK